MTLIEADPFCIGLIGNVCGKHLRADCVDGADCVDDCSTSNSKTLDLTMKTNRGKPLKNVVKSFSNTPL